MRPAAAAFITVVLLGIAGLVGYRAVQIAQQRRKVAAGNAKEAKAIRVRTQRVEKADLALTVPVTGEVEALAAADVVPKVTGRLERLRLPDGTLLEEGVRVEKGQPLALLERAALSAAVDAASAAVEVARASQEGVRVKMAECRREKDRWEGLFRGGSATEQQRDRAADAYAMCQAESKLAESQTRAAEAGLAQARVQLAEATLTAPVTGVVSRKHMDEGDMALAGRPLVRVVQIDTVKIVGGVSERHLARLVPGRTRAHVLVDAYPDKSFGGVVSRVGTDVDRRTRTVSVEVRVENPGHRLRPGMFARLALELDRREGVAAVPEEALVRHEDEIYVFVAGDGKARKRALRLGLREGGRHEVLEGLAPGEDLIVKGQQLVRDGDAVHVEEDGK